LSCRGSSADFVIASESRKTDIVGIAAISSEREIGTSVVAADEGLSSCRETVEGRVAGGANVVGSAGTGVTHESVGTAVSSIFALAEG